MNSLPLHQTATPLNGPTGTFCLHRQAAQDLGHAVAVKLRIIANGGGQQFGIKHPRFGFNHLNPMPSANCLRIGRSKNFGPQSGLQQFQAGNISAQVGQFVGRAKAVHHRSVSVADATKMPVHR